LKINQTKTVELETKRWIKFVSTMSILVVGQKLDGEIIIYSSKQLFILEKNSNSISFDQSHTIKENKKKVFN
jgi:hypothetical protein